ncbi:hypothetical protein D3C75_1173120 [compost metagenome]
MVSFSQSSFFMSPFRSALASMLPSAQIIRWTSWAAPISKEKMATVSLARTPIFWATFKAKAVLPTEGRAATIIRSERWKPEVILSRSIKPEGMPVAEPRC